MTLSRLFCRLDIVMYMESSGKLLHKRDLGKLSWTWEQTIMSSRLGIIFETLHCKSWEQLVWSSLHQALLVNGDSHAKFHKKTDCPVYVLDEKQISKQHVV